MTYLYFPMETNPRISPGIPWADDIWIVLTPRTTPRLWLELAVPQDGKLSICHAQVKSHGANIPCLSEKIETYRENGTIIGNGEFAPQYKTAILDLFNVADIGKW